MRFFGCFITYSLFCKKTDLAKIKSAFSCRLDFLQLLQKIHLVLGEIPWTKLVCSPREQRQTIPFSNSHTEKDASHMKQNGLSLGGLKCFGMKGSFKSRSSQISPRFRSYQIHQIAPELHNSCSQHQHQPISFPFGCYFCKKQN